jgi:hypothetical protein
MMSVNMTADGGGFLAMAVYLERNSSFGETSDITSLLQALCASILQTRRHVPAAHHQA